MVNEYWVCDWLAPRTERRRNALKDTNTSGENIVLARSYCVTRYLGHVLSQTVVRQPASKYTIAVKYVPSLFLSTLLLRN